MRRCLFIRTCELWLKSKEAAFPALTPDRIVSMETPLWMDKAEPELPGFTLVKVSLKGYDLITFGYPGFHGRMTFHIRKQGQSLGLCFFQSPHLITTGFADTS
jgi:hypothetical protein